jgi:hypothetical protein
MKVVKVICALLICGFVSVSHAGIFKLNVENGILMGADNVEVNGSLYNVRFLDGTCIALFNGCSEASDFLFNSEETATAAASSLIDQVFGGGSVGEQFLTSWTLIAGCGNAEVCSMYTPRGNVESGVDVGRLLSSIINIDIDGIELYRDDVNIVSLSSTIVDFKDYDDLVYAVWTVAVEVSAPGTAMILLMGIAGLLVSQRRKQA